MNSDEAPAKGNTALFDAWRAEVPVTDLAEQFGMTPSQVRARISDARRRGEDLPRRRSRLENDQRPQARRDAVRLHKAGHTPSAIAEHLGLSYYVVLAMLREAGVSPSEQTLRRVEERDQTVMRMYTQGASLAAIAEAVSLSEIGVANRLMQLRERQPDSTPPARRSEASRREFAHQVDALSREGLPKREIARRLGLTPSALASRMRRARKDDLLDP